MPRGNTIRFRRRQEEVLEVIRLKGRSYFVLERLSRRGACRVFDPHAGPSGDYRVLYRFPYSRGSRQKIESLRHMTGPAMNRNFPQIVDYVRQRSELFVVLNWIWGTSLREYLVDVGDKKTARPSVYETIRLFRGLAHGVSHYHRRAHLIHGDISPANLIITARTKQLVLIDFGSAWPVVQSAQKEIGDGISLPYAAPERITGCSVEDWRADQFSLAAVAYEMLTLSIPFDGAGGQAGTPAFGQPLHAKFAPPSELLPRQSAVPKRIGARLDQHFRVMLSLDPRERYETRKVCLDAWDCLLDELRKPNRPGFARHILSLIPWLQRYLS